MNGILYISLLNNQYVLALWGGSPGDLKAISGSRVITMEVQEEFITPGEDRIGQCAPTVFSQQRSGSCAAIPHLKHKQGS